MSSRPRIQRFELDGNSDLRTRSRSRNPSCKTWQHQWSIDQAQPAIAESFFSKIPVEVILKIFRHLNVYELGQVSLVCRQFKMIADHDDLWKVKCDTKYKLYSKSFKEMYMDWMYEKYLRNAELHEVESEYHSRMAHVACGMRCSPPRYPVRPSGTVTFEPIGGFTVHPNTSQEMTIQLSVDVQRTARELISLLNKASKFQEHWRNSPVIKQMIKRYYRFMQLKATLPTNLLLIPTLDIEMVWQTHLLRPSMYRDDCLRLFHRVIDHSLLMDGIDQFLKEQAFIDTCRLYEERFGEEYCPLPSAEMRANRPKKYEHPLFGSLKSLIPIYSYWDQTSYEFSSTVPDNYGENPFSFTEADIILDGNWLNLCKRFMNEAWSKAHISSYRSLPRNEIDLSAGAMNRLVKSYERFLYISTKYPPTNGYSYVHPTYAIDIIWHAHMQEPLKYASDCDRLAGYLIDHAPWPSVDRKDMKEACEGTVKVWENEFQVEMSTDHLYNTSAQYREPWSD